MKVDEAASSSVRVLRRRPVEVLPAFLAQTALGIVATAVLLLTGGAVVAVLGPTGRIQRVAEATRGTSTPPTEAEATRIQEAIAGLFTPGVIGILLAGFVATAVALVIVRAATSAAKAHAARAAMTDDAPIQAGVEGVLTDTRTFVGLTVIEAILLGLFLGPLALVYVLVEGGVVAAGLGVLVLWLFVGVPVILVGYFLLLFAPAAVAVEGVGAIGGIRRGTRFVLDHPARALVYAILEPTFLFGVTIAGSVLGVVGISNFAAIGYPFLVVPLLSLIKLGVYADVTPPTGRPGSGEEPTAKRPAPAGTRTDGGRENPDDPASDREEPDLPYGSRVRTDPDASPGDHRDDGEGSGDHRDDHWGDREVGHRDEPDRDPLDSGRERSRDPEDERRIPPDGPEAASGDDVWRPDPGASTAGNVRAGLGRGWAELRRFVPRHVGLTLLSIGAFGAGTALGYLLVSTLGIDLVSGVEPDLDVGLFPAGFAIDLAINNWMVAISQAYAGLAFGVPTVINLVFNGLVVGTIAAIGFEPLEITALIAPHGILEVPAIAVAGALGLHLFRRAVGLVRGGVPPAAFAGDVRRAFLVLLGLLPVFLAAGVIEAFVTPRIAQAVVDTVAR